MQDGPELPRPHAGLLPHSQVPTSLGPMILLTDDLLTCKSSFFATAAGALTSGQAQNAVVDLGLGASLLQSAHPAGWGEGLGLQEVTEACGGGKPGLDRRTGLFRH